MSIADIQTPAELDALDTLNDHLVLVGERCIAENRAPTDEEIERHDEVDAAHRAAVAARRASETRNPDPAAKNTSRRIL